jgi:AraC family transcriptional regulator
MLMNTQTYQTYSAQISTVQRYIRDHMDEPLNREVLASIANFSIPHLHRIFTGCVGENIASYVRRVRLERAGRKLRIGAVDITEVALAAGYKSHAAFGKAFKQQYGYSPSEFRQLNCWTATLILRKVNYHED